MSSKVSEQLAVLSAKAAESLKQLSGGDRIRIQVGSATCENAAGAVEVLAEFRKYLAASGRTDVVLHQTGCTGRCSREPIVGVMIPGQLPVKYERVDRNLVHEIFTRHIMGGQPLLDHVLDGPIEKMPQYEILLCGNARCGWKGPGGDFAAVVAEKFKAAGIGSEQVGINSASCFGVCRPRTPATYSHMLVRPDKVLYRVANEADLDEIIREHIQGGRIVARLSIPGKTVRRKFFELYGDVAFFNRQNRIALRHNGVIDPESIEEYFHYRGFQALAKVLERATRSG